MPSPLLRTVSLIAAIPLLSGDGITQEPVAGLEAVGDVSATGVVESRDPVLIINRTGRDSVLIYITPDRSQVKQGDLLFEFDDAPLQDDLAVAEIEASAAQTRESQAQNVVARLKDRFESEMTNAREEQSVADLNHARLLGEDGKLTQKINLATSKLRLAKENLLISQGKLDALSTARATQDELRRHRYLRDTARHEVERWEKRIAYLQGPERKYLTARHELTVKKIRSQLKWLQLDFEENLAKADSELAFAHRAVEQTQEERDNIEEQIAATRVLAPRNGLLVHRNLVDQRTMEEFVVEEGASVRDFQAIAEIPDMSRLQVKVTVRAEDRAAIQVGQVATIRFDGREGHRSAGTLTKISDFPERRRWDDDSKYYTVFVSLDNPPDGVEPGDSVDVVIASAKDGR